MKKLLYITIFTALFSNSVMAQLKIPLTVTLVRPLSFPSGFAGMNDVTIVAPFDRGSAVFSVRGDPFARITFIVEGDGISLCSEAGGCMNVINLTYSGPQRLDGEGNAVISVGGKISTTMDAPGGRYRGGASFSVSVRE